MSSDEYDLKKSEEKVGPLYRVIRANWGDNPIIDGYHRKNVDSEWPEEVLEKIDSKEKFLKARIIANLHRRTVPGIEIKAWINELADFALIEKGIEPGQISGWIVEETGYSESQVNSYLDEKYKDPVKVLAAKSRYTAPITVAPVSVEAEIAEKVGQEKVERLREEIKEEIGFKYDIPELLEESEPDIIIERVIQKPEIKERAKKELKKDPEFLKEASIEYSRKIVQEIAQQTKEEKQVREKEKTSQKYRNLIENTYYKIRGWGIPMIRAMGSDQWEESKWYIQAIHNWTGWLLELNNKGNIPEPPREPIEIDARRIISVEYQIIEEAE